VARSFTFPTDANRTPNISQLRAQVGSSVVQSFLAIEGVFLVNRLRAVSLFANCGAGDVGFRQAGFRFDVIAELEAHRLKVALLNHPGATGVPGDLLSTLPEVVKSWRDRNGAESPALLAACPPCQGMSTARSSRGYENDVIAGSRDPRNFLVRVVIDAAMQLTPRVVVVENVRAFLSKKVISPETGVAISAAAFIMDCLEANYVLWPLLADLADFGVPQNRTRSFLTFIRRDESCVSYLEKEGFAPFPKPTNAGSQVTLRSALAAMKLRSLDAATLKGAIDPVNKLHRVPILSAARHEMVAAIPANSGKTAWQNNACLGCGMLAESAEAASCKQCGAALPRPVVVQADGTLRLISGFRRSSYSRMDPNRPASTITTASGRVGSDNTIHPSQNRVLSTLECQLLQGIPIDFKWGDAIETKGHGAVRAMIGEAVPPLFTAQHGEVLRQLLKGNRPKNAMEVGDRRVTKAVSAIAKAGRLNTDSPEFESPHSK
jgi:DNA (cytosine-5)-methyltransferase 1